MTKGAVTRKQLLKEPDRFMTLSGQMIAFGRSYLKPILVGAAVFVALLLTGSLMFHLSERKASRASEQTEKLMAKYQAALQDTDQETAYERVKPDFAALFDQYGTEPAAKIARIVFGDISYSAGDTDTAISMYTRALDDYGQAAEIKNILFSGLGHAYAKKKDYPQAIRYFEMISSGQEKTLKDDALYNLAYLYDSTGEKEKSKAMFNQLLKDFPGNPYEDLIKEKISS